MQQTTVVPMQGNDILVRLSPSCRMPLAFYIRPFYGFRVRTGPRSANQGGTQAATWRSGYAADCKSKPIANNAKHIDILSYQDIPRTECESDNSSNSPYNGTALNVSLSMAAGTRRMMDPRISDRPRDATLSLRWESRDHWQSINSALGCDDRSETFAAVAIALYTEAVGAGCWVSYSRRKPHYEMPRRYRSSLYTYARVVGAADRLDAMGLIDHAKAEPGQRGWQSAMLATPELVSLVGSALESGLILRKPPEPVILRDAEKKPIDYRDTRETMHMRREVEAQNEAIAGAQFGGANVVQFIAPLRRIFNERLSQGGRFYAEGGVWQQLSKPERLRLQIDGESVVEIDYSQFHPTLAYARVGHSAPEYAYDIPGFERSLVKVSFNIMLNSGSRNGTRHTIAHTPEMVQAVLGDDFPNDLQGENLWYRAEAKHPGFVQTASRQAQRLLDAIIAKHAPISQMFFTGVGLALQRLDSDIAEGVMKEMRHRGIVVLPVHDSFLAPASKATELEAVMVDEAAKFGASVFCSRSSIVPMG